MAEGDKGTGSGGFQQYGMAYEALFSAVRDDFNAANDTALRNLLVEFGDHRLIVRVPTSTGGEDLWISLRKERLQLVLNSWRPALKEERTFKCEKPELHRQVINTKLLVLRRPFLILLQPCPAFSCSHAQALVFQDGSWSLELNGVGHKDLLSHEGNVAVR